MLLLLFRPKSLFLLLFIAEIRSYLIEDLSIIHCVFPDFIVIYQTSERSIFTVAYDSGE